MTSRASITGRVFDIQKFSLHDGPGIRTLVFFQGCPLSCWWCSNPEGQGGPTLLFRAQQCRFCGRCQAACPRGHTVSDSHHRVDRTECRACGACAASCLSDCLQVAGRSMGVEQIMDVVRQDAVFYETSGGGITLGGGDPLAQPAFAEALLRQCRCEGIHTAMETAGHASTALVDALVPWVDYWLVDLKHIDTDAHRRGTGVANRRILANIRRLVAQNVALKLRIPLIPQFNAARASLEAMAAFVRSLAPGSQFDGVELMPLHVWAGSKYEQLGRTSPFEGLPRQGSDRLRVCAKIFENASLSVFCSGAKQ